MAAGSDRATRSCTRTTASSRGSTASSSTTSSSWVSATGRTSPSTSDAESDSRTSRTRPSRRWCPRSTSSSCAPTTSSGGSHDWQSSSACPRQVASAENEEELVANLVGSDAGERWLADFEQTKDPWFYFSCGTGVFHHHHRSWIDDTRLPVQTIGSYIARLDAGEDISRPREAALAERERITEGHRALLSPELREAFDESLALARTVFPYVENHHFYIDHRYFTIFWNKVREFGALLARVGFLADGEDVFLLRHDEVRSALEALRLDWSSGGAGVPHGPLVWPPLVERRRAVYHAMCAWAQPPALGPLHEEITDPISIMLWGITDERVRDWLSSDGDEAETLTGCPASPGVAEGLARVLLRVDQLGELEDGEILVAPVTSPSWTPVFHRIAGAVLDTGGIMCHAAIVAREYGLPAVVGTGTGTKRIRSGDRLRVDATTGVVTILERAPV